jgi:Putative lumazine-binding
MPSTSDREAIVRACTDYVESWLDGDGGRMASCLHPALAKRAVIDSDAGTLDLDEAPFAYMTTTAVEGGPKPYGRGCEIEILHTVDGIATVRVLSELYVDLVHAARFGDRWLIVTVLYEPRRRIHGSGDHVAVLRALDDYSQSWFDRDVEAVRRAVHPALAERRVLDPADGSLDLEEVTLRELLQVVAEGPDEPVDRRWVAEVLDVSGNIASGRVSTAWWDRYLHVARFGDRWMIVNSLYRSRDDPA